MAAAIESRRKLLILFGTLHLVFSILGLYVILTTVRSVGFLHDDADVPLVVECFYAMTIINTLFIASLALAGYRLLRSGVAAIPFSNLVTVGEIVYFFLLPVVWLVPNLRTSVASATGIGNVGIMVQGVLLYPLASLVILTNYRGRFPA